MQILAFILSIAFATSQYNQSWISAAGLFPANHGSTIVELPNNQLMSCWYAGSREGDDDVQIYCSQKNLNNQSSWSAPQVVVNRHDRANYSWFVNKTVGNPSLFLDPENVLWLFYTSVQIGGWSGGKVDYKISKDFGKTWSHSERLISDFGNLTRTKPLLLGTSPVRFMLPLYHEFISKNGYTCIIEARQGEIQDQTCSEIPGKNHLQPALVKLDNRIFAYLRDSTKNHVLVSEYDETNNEWSRPIATNLSNPDSSIDVVDFNHQILIAYNSRSDERSPLSLAASTDGIVFHHLWDFEPYSVNKEYSYPAIIQTSNGGFQVSYSFEKRNAIKNVEFNKEWLENLLALRLVN